MACSISTTVLAPQVVKIESNSRVVHVLGREPDLVVHVFPKLGARPWSGKTLLKVLFVLRDPFSLSCTGATFLLSVFDNGVIF